MGTLFNQEPRSSLSVSESKLRLEVELLKNIAKETGLTYNQVLATRNMLETERKNFLYVHNGDIFDEQLAGFGKLIKKFISVQRQIIKYKDCDANE